MKNPIGIYEKALPRDLGWPERFSAARDAGYDFVEISVDETPERMARLDWTLAERLAFFRASREAGVPVPSMCLSGHRKIPFGSADAAVRARAAEFMDKAIRFAGDTGIRVIQLAGYDVYYEPTTADSRARYLEGMQRALEVAARHQVMLALEIMDTTFLNSITKYLALKKQLPSPWFCVYPDLGNLTACGEVRSPMPTSTTPLPMGITSPPSSVARPWWWSGSPHHSVTAGPTARLKAG